MEKSHFTDKIKYKDIKNVSHEPLRIQNWNIVIKNCQNYRKKLSENKWSGEI